MVVVEKKRPWQTPLFQIILCQSTIYTSLDAIRNVSVCPFQSMSSSDYRRLPAKKTRPLLSAGDGAVQVSETPSVSRVFYPESNPDSSSSVIASVDRNRTDCKMVFITDLKIQDTSRAKIKKEVSQTLMGELLEAIINPANIDYSFQQLSHQFKQNEL